MILADTSAWIEFDRATGSGPDLALAEAIGAGGNEIACTEPVLMEVLAGARDRESHDRLRRLLTSFGWLSTDPVADFEGAARVYLVCRRAGVTPRGLIDCMIVNIALRTGAELLAADHDFALIADVVPLSLTPTPPA